MTAPIFRLLRRTPTNMTTMASQATAVMMAPPMTGVESMMMMEAFVCWFVECSMI